MNMAAGQSSDNLICQLSKVWTAPDKKRLRVIDNKSIRLIFTKKRIPLLEVEISCLEQNIV
jgi:hypothetical protein